MAYYNNNSNNNPNYNGQGGGGYGNHYDRPQNNYHAPANPYDQPRNGYGRPANQYDDTRPANPYDQPANGYGRPPNQYNSGRPVNQYDNNRPTNQYDQSRSDFGSSAPPAYGQASNLEMQPMGHQPDQYSMAPAPPPVQAQRDPNAILNECRAVSRALDDIESRLGELQRLQRAFLGGQGQSNKDIDALSADIMTGYRGLTDRVRRIKGMREARDPRNRAQVDSLDRKIRTAINSYQKIEAAFRREVNESQRRQYLIVNPNATEHEIQEATAGGGDTQIFQQALMNSDRRGQAQSTLRSVHQRHEAIQQIERTMEELNQLFQDLDQLIIEQDPIVQDIETKAEQTVVHLQKANDNQDKAIVSARGARRKKWICLGICVAIIVVIILIIVIYLAVTGRLGGGGGGGGNNNNNNSGH